MLVLRFILPSRVAELIPVQGADRNPAHAGEVLQPPYTLDDGIRKAALLNCAVLIALFGLGTVAARWMDSDELYLEWFRHFLVFVAKWYQLDPDARSSMLVFWFCMSVLTWLMCLVPLFVLAVSETAAYVASTIFAPLLGFWMTTISLQWLGNTASVHAGIAIGAGCLVFMAGYRWTAAIIVAITLFALQPWTYINWGGNLWGAAALYLLIFPGYTAYIVLKKVFGVLDMDSTGLNETNAPVVIFAMTTMAASLLFILSLARIIYPRRNAAEG